MKDKMKKFWNGCKSFCEEHKVGCNILLMLSIFAAGYLVSEKTWDDAYEKLKEDGLEEIRKANVDGFVEGRNKGELLAWIHAFMADRDLTEKILSHYNSEEALKNKMEMLENLSMSEGYKEFCEHFNIHTIK